jgi:hypothetical protein
MLDAHQQNREDADLQLIEAMRPRVVSGEPNTERKSTFQVGGSSLLPGMAGCEMSGASYV